MAKLSISVVSGTSPAASSPVPAPSTSSHTEMSSNAKPVTHSPMTAPARKATFSPSFSESRAARAVRAEALVAVFMPR